MNSDRPHRKRVRHYDRSGDAHALTFSCYRKLDLLTDDRILRLLSEAVDRARQTAGFGLTGFVFMPNHVHLLVFPTRDDATVSALLYAIKRPFSYRAKQLWTAERSPWIDRLAVRERPARLTFRFWQEGGGFDDNLSDPAEVRRTLDYMHANPIRRGLCVEPADWRCSSWHHWSGDRLPDSLPVVDGWPDAW